MRYILLTCLLATFSLVSFDAPLSFVVKGKITDEKGNPIHGASVFEKGKQSGTSSDEKGEFSLSVSNEKATLVITYIGYERLEVAVNNKTTLAIKMVADIGTLNETVVIGYGNAKKQNLSFSSPSVPYSTMQTPANTVPLQALQGKVSGVVIGGYGSTRRGKKDKSNVIADEEFNTEEYDGIVENRFLTVDQNPLSTFSIDVDAASYSNVRRYLQNGQLPPAGAVRIEEMINYFHYNYPQPEKEDPFSINTEMSDCPWNPQHKLVLIGLQGKKIPMDDLAASNLVFLIDVSGSMMSDNKLPLVKASMKLLVDQLREQDKVAIVVYAGNAGLVLPPTSGAEKTTIKDAINRLNAGGSTAGGAGIQLAYKTAKANFLENGNNRVILCTDGDFNVGTSSNAALEELITEERESGVFLTVLGYGMGNYKDSKMQQLADKGNGNHAYIDNFTEAKKVLVSEFGGTLFTIAKDVKLQLEFNPAKVQAYRLVGYENRMLNKEDFNNDKKDAGDLGSGHTVTALYEIIPVGVKNEFAEKVDPLKYKEPLKNTVVANSNEIMTVKFRYKQPGGLVSKLITHAVTEKSIAVRNTSDDFRFATAVAEFGMLLRKSEFKQQASFDNAWTLAKDALGSDEEGYRAEFLKLLKNARSLAKKDNNREEAVSIK
jgi:Ca-activated chloride channel family protein